jgi:hypothetical protein
MATKVFWFQNFLGAFRFWGTLKFTYIKGFAFFIFPHFLFNMYLTLIVWTTSAQKFEDWEGGVHALFFVIFVISIFFKKKNVKQSN